MTFITGLTDLQLRASPPPFTTPPVEALLAQILTELRVTNALLQIGLGVKDDPAELRDDYSQLLT